MADLVEGTYATSKGKLSISQLMALGDDVEDDSSDSRDGSPPWDEINEMDAGQEAEADKVCSYLSHSTSLTGNMFIDRCF